MNKIKIFEFVEEYKKLADNENSKDEYINNMIEFVDYIPLIKKVTLAENIVKASCIDKETGTVRVNSVVSYFLFCRTLIEQWTNLESETQGWYEEYDALKSCGLLEIIMSFIPENEFNEFKTILDMTQSDFMTNNYETKAFISNQIERIKNVLNVIVKPIADALSKKIDKLSENDIEEFGNRLEKIIKRVK